MKFLFLAMGFIAMIAMAGCGTTASGWPEACGIQLDAANLNDDNLIEPQEFDCAAVYNHVLPGTAIDARLGARR